MPKPYYITGLENAAQAFMSGLQAKQARQQREQEHLQEIEQQRQSFLRNFQAQQATAGNVGAARQLDQAFGQTPSVPEGFGSLIAKPDQVTNPTALNEAQRKLMGGINSMQGLPTNGSSHYYQDHAAFTPSESQALQQGQEAFEQQNLTGLTGLSQGKSSPAFMGAFEQFAQQQQLKQQQALEQRQAEVKRAQDEKYFEDVDRAVLEGRVSPANATKYFQAKRDYVAGKTTELPAVDFREKPDNTGENRLQTARDRKTNTLLTALSRTDTAIQSIDDNISQQYEQWNKFTQDNNDPRVIDAASAGFIKKINDFQKERQKIDKRRNEFNKMLETLMKEEGLNVPTDFAVEPKVDETKKQRVQQAANQIYQTLLKAGQPSDYARSEAVRRFGFDPLSGQFLDESKFQGQSTGSLVSTPITTGPQAVANQALQSTEDKASRAKALLDQAGYESDDNAVRTFLQNNPNF